MNIKLPLKTGIIHNKLFNMGQRNMLYASQMIELEREQYDHGHLNPEPCVIYGSITNFPPPNIHTVAPTPVNPANFDVRRLPENHDSALFYGMMQYNGVQHHQPAAGHDLAVANHYAPYMTPASGTRVFPIPQNQGSCDQLPFSSNHGIIGVSTDSYRRSSHLVDGHRGVFKRKNAEGIRGNFQGCNASAGSSSAVTHMSSRPRESDVTLMDAASFALPEYGRNDALSVVEVGSHRGVRNISDAIGLDSVMAHGTNHITQGNYMGQPFQTAGTPWLDTQFSCNGGDIHTFTWNQAPTLPYLHGSINSGLMEAGNMCVQGYHVTASNRSSTSYLHPPPIPQGHPNLHHPRPPPPPPSHSQPQPHPPMQGVRGHNIDLHSQVVTSSRRHSTNSTSHISRNPDGVEAGPRFVGPVAPTSFGIYRPYQREAMFEANSRQRTLPQFRVLPEDGVAMLDVPSYHEVRDFIDHHRDMRLDIDHMSYEVNVASPLACSSTMTVP
ncbi:unnamed protein product [Ilex paraguariensis]|uniref:Uncharacterized protein n=1 Tax=Ilex paraguariensis TaxID=185542 RepID=A0ABC8UPM3_9AQUA